MRRSGVPLVPRRQSVSSQVITRHPRRVPARHRNRSLTASWSSA